jgi:hypothetical protein
LNAGSTSLKFKQANRSTIFASVSGSPGQTVNDIIKYSNVATIDGVVVDAVLTTVEKTNITINNYDEGSAVGSTPPPGSSQTVDDLFLPDVTASGSGTTDSILGIKFQFFEGGTYTGLNTGIPVTLTNVYLNSYDIDGTQSSNRQFTDFRGFQNYKAFTVDASKGLELVNKGNGLVRFRALSGNASASGTSGSYSWSRVQVTYDQLTELTVRVGVEGSGGAYFGLDFSASTTWTTDGTNAVTPTSSPNPNNTAPVTSNISLYDPTGVGFVFRSADFPYSDADANAFTSVKIVSLPTAGNGLLEFFNGTAWVPVTAGQVITVADLDLGKLRLTGSATDSFTFQVNDGLAFSNTGTVNYTVVAQSQVITFANPGAKQPSQSFASGATTDSGLTVTLTSLTPGVCSVTGLTINTLGVSGTCVIVATQSGNSSYGQAQAVTQQFAVSTLTAQTVTFANPGNTAFVSGGSIASVATASSGLTPVLISNTPSVCTVSGLNIIQVSAGVCEIRATQPGNGTYAPASPVIRTFNLTSAPSLTAQTINYTQPLDQLLSGTVLTVSPTATSGLTVTLTSTTPNVCSASGLVIYFLTTGTCTTVASQAGDSTYAAATSVTRSFNITSASLNAQTINYTQPLDQLLSGTVLTVSPTATSGLTVTLTSTTPNVCSASGLVIYFLTTGTCTTVANQSGNGTYSAATSVTRSFNITTASLTTQTITLPNPGAQILSSNTVILNPSATSGLTVLLTSSTPSVCTISGNVVTFVGPGTCTIVGNQAGNGTYSAATAVTISFLITGTSTPTVVTPPATTPTTRFTQSITPVTPKTSQTVKPSATPTATASPATAAPAASTGQRSVGEIASESIGGFKPGAGLRIEVTGSRISGQFVVSPASIADPVALATAIEESTSRTKSNFAQVNSVVPATTAPQSSQIFDTPITTKVSDVFVASGLEKPRTVGDLKPSTKQKWLSVDASVSSYVPGSTVYLVVTTQPTILAAATVGNDGKASLDGLLPVDLLDAGGHNIRLVGTRLIDGVSADSSGNITLDDSAISEIKKFDEGTKATVALYGKSTAGSTMSAVREVYLDKVVAWWTVWLAAGIGLLALLIRFLRGPAGFRRRLTTGILAFAGGIPAFIIGWITASYELWIGTGIGLAVAAIVLFWGRVGNKLNRMND